MLVGTERIEDPCFEVQINICYRHSAGRFELDLSVRTYPDLGSMSGCPNSVTGLIEAAYSMCYAEEENSQSKSLQGAKASSSNPFGSLTSTRLLLARMWIWLNEN